jgi:hypothetical protein
MRTVIMMSNRGNTRRSWYDLIVAAAQRTAFDAPDTGSTGTLQFLADFSGPDFDSDLYAVDVRTRAIRQLTHFPHAIVPEFYWDPAYTRIIWGLNAHDGHGGFIQSTWTGQFTGPIRARRTATRDLYGQPVAMARVGSQAQSIRDPGPTDNVPWRVRPPAHPAPAFPHSGHSSDTASVPSVVLSYLSEWQRQLRQLGQAAGESFIDTPLSG